MHNAAFPQVKKLQAVMLAAELDIALFNGQFEFVLLGVDGGSAVYCSTIDPFWYPVVPCLGVVLVFEVAFSCSARGTRALHAVLV